MLVSGILVVGVATSSIGSCVLLFVCWVRPFACEMEDCNHNSVECNAGFETLIGQRFEGRGLKV